MGYMVVHRQHVRHVDADGVHAAVLYALNMYFQSFGAVSIVKVNAAVVPPPRARHVRRHLRHPDLARPLLRLRRRQVHRRRRCRAARVAVLDPGRDPGRCSSCCRACSCATSRRTPATPTSISATPARPRRRAPDGPRQVFVKLLHAPGDPDRSRSSSSARASCARRSCSGAATSARASASADSFVVRELGHGVVHRRHHRRHVRRRDLRSPVQLAARPGVGGALRHHARRRDRDHPAARRRPRLRSAGWSRSCRWRSSACTACCPATASADFGGKKNTGIAVGIIDGFVYLGSTVAVVPLRRVPAATKVSSAPTTALVANPAASDIDNWTIWPYAMIPVALVGFVLVAADLERETRRRRRSSSKK